MNILITDENAFHDIFFAANDMLPYCIGNFSVGMSFHCSFQWNTSRKICYMNGMELNLPGFISFAIQVMSGNHADSVMTKGF